MIIVLDTDIVVAAMRSPTGASAALIRMGRRTEIALAASVSLFMEYEAVCTRPAHVAASGLSAEQVTIFLDALASFVKPVEVHYLWRPQLRDPADEMVLEAAVNAQATALVSFNLRHFASAARLFNLRLESPGQFLRSLK
ncbi:MAG: putative toxin-antitoxin system toxin component, PIN family [Rhodoferax sp.]|nr:putative toxin-antitoxin system toxin component, PIN family [Rhodoferax sp.]